MPDVDINQIKHKYKKFLLNVLSENSIFILISCNFTKSQLFEDLMLEKSFILLHEIKSPTFNFGGQTGAQVTGLVLKTL